MHLSIASRKVPRKLGGTTVMAADAQYWRAIFLDAQGEVSCFLEHANSKKTTLRCSLPIILQRSLSASSYGCSCCA